MLVRILALAMAVGVALGAAPRYLSVQVPEEAKGAAGGPYGQ